METEIKFWVEAFFLVSYLHEKNWHCFFYLDSNFCILGWNICIQGVTICIQGVTVCILGVAICILCETICNLDLTSVF